MLLSLSEDAAIVLGEILGWGWGEQGSERSAARPAIEGWVQSPERLRDTGSAQGHSRGFWPKLLRPQSVAPAHLQGASELLVLEQKLSHVLDDRLRHFAHLRLGGRPAHTVFPLFGFSLLFPLAHRRDRSHRIAGRAEFLEDLVSNPTRGSSGKHGYESGRDDAGEGEAPAGVAANEEDPCDGRCGLRGEPPVRLSRPKRRRRKCTPGRTTSPSGRRLEDRLGGPDLALLAPLPEVPPSSRPPGLSLTASHLNTSPDPAARIFRFMLVCFPRPGPGKRR